MAINGSYDHKGYYHRPCKPIGGGYAYHTQINFGPWHTGTKMQARVQEVSGRPSTVRVQLRSIPTKRRRQPKIQKKTGYPTYGHPDSTAMKVEIVVRGQRVDLGDYINGKMPKNGSEPA